MSQFAALLGAVPAEMAALFRRPCSTCDHLCGHDYLGVVKAAFCHSAIYLICLAREHQVDCPTFLPALCHAHHLVRPSFCPVVCQIVEVG